MTAVLRPVWPNITVRSQGSGRHPRLDCNRSFLNLAFIVTGGMSSADVASNTLLAEILMKVNLVVLQAKS